MPNYPEGDVRPVEGVAVTDSQLVAPNELFTRVSKASDAIKQKIEDGKLAKSSFLTETIEGYIRVEDSIYAGKTEADVGAKILKSYMNQLEQIAEGDHTGLLRAETVAKAQSLIELLKS